MAKVVKNPVVRGISGSIGNLVFRQMPDGSTYVSGKHDFSRRKFSQRQKDHQSRFRRAVTYAREASKSQPVYAKLAEGTIMSPYNWALSDWFNPPVIHKLERTERSIHIWASDNVMVTKVQITVLDEEGKEVEKREARQVDNDWWEYEMNAEGKIIVEAWDLAGNVGSLVVG
jgi:hypothetical protein